MTPVRSNGGHSLLPVVETKRMPFCIIATASPLAAPERPAASIRSLPRCRQATPCAALDALQSKQNARFVSTTGIYVSISNSTLNGRKFTNYFLQVLAKKKSPKKPYAN